MLAFGMGTLPVGLLVGVAGARLRMARWGKPVRPLAATVMAVFGLQLALRGLAAWDWIEHMQLGSVMLW
jgi:sulfite exporter TauE/SafE